MSSSDGTTMGVKRTTDQMSVCKLCNSTPTHYGNPGYGYLKRDHGKEIDFRPDEIGMALIAVYATERNRKSIFTALYDRHC
ncbi:MAG: hypothetical protein E4H40_07465 [Candidatus Brocadiia bacterium]|nr:MAG: hypothetical protein E4H40_07465 [Candidatus Brocadiia bacterium]